MKIYLAPPSPYNCKDGQIRSFRLFVQHAPFQAVVLLRLTDIVFAEVVEVDLVSTDLPPSFRPVLRIVCALLRLI